MKGGRGRNPLFAPPDPSPSWASQAETKTKKAAESLRRSVEKYNSARTDFEQKMLDSALVRTGHPNLGDRRVPGSVGRGSPEPLRALTPRSLRIAGVKP